MTPLRRLGILAICVLLGACAQLQRPEVKAGQRQYIITLKVPATAAPGIPSDSDRGYLLSNRWQLPMSTRRQIRLLVQDYGLTVVDSWPLKSIHEFCLVIADPGERLHALTRDARLASVEPISRFVSMGHQAVTDTPSSRFTDKPQMQKLHGWSTGKGIRVGIIDTAVDLRHPALERQIASESIFTVKAPGLPDLVHGTAVSGIIAANRDIGFAPGAKLHIYGACHFSSDIDKTVCNTFSLAKAMEAAVADHLDVVNISLAGPYDALLARQIRAMADTGTIIVAADNPDSNSLRFPAMMTRVISATVPDDKRPLEPKPIRVEDEHYSTRAGGGYQFFYGSSMSAARVTGLITLLLQKQPGLTPTAALQMLGDIDRHCTAAQATAACTLKFALATGKPAYTIEQVQR